MKRTFMLLMLVLTVGIVSAFAGNENTGGEDNTNPFQVKQDLPDFNLNKDLFSVRRTPDCKTWYGDPVYPTGPTDSNYGTQTKVYEQTTPSGDSLQTWEFKCTQYDNYGPCQFGCTVTKSYNVVVYN